MPCATAGVDDAAAITETVLAFWFERDIAPGYCEVRPVWFESPPEFDAEIAEEAAFLAGPEGEFWRA